MRLWIDSLRPAPEGYEWCKSTDEAKQIIEELEQQQQYLQHTALNKLYCRKLSDYHKLMQMSKRREIELIDADDNFDLLVWFQMTCRNYPIRIHSQNPIGVQNMRRIIERNGWKEIK